MAFIDKEVFDCTTIHYNVNLYTNYLSDLTANNLVIVVNCKKSLQFIVYIIKQA